MEDILKQVATFAPFIIYGLIVLWGLIYSLATRKRTFGRSIYNFATDIVYSVLIVILISFLSIRNLGLEDTIVKLLNSVVPDLVSQMEQYVGRDVILGVIDIVFHIALYIVFMMLPTKTLFRNLIFTLILGGFRNSVCGPKNQFIARKHRKLNFLVNFVHGAVSAMVWPMLILALLNILIGGGIKWDAKANASIFQVENEEVTESVISSINSINSTNPYRFAGFILNPMFNAATSGVIDNKGNKLSLGQELSWVATLFRGYLDMTDGEVNIFDNGGGDTTTTIPDSAYKNYAPVITSDSLLINKVVPVKDSLTQFYIPKSVNLPKQYAEEASTKIIDSKKYLKMKPAFKEMKKSELLNIAYTALIDLQGKDLIQSLFTDEAFTSSALEKLSTFSLPNFLYDVLDGIVYDIVDASDEGITLIMDIATNFNIDRLLALNNDKGINAVNRALRKVADLEIIEIFDELIGDYLETNVIKDFILNNLPVDPSIKQTEINNIINSIKVNFYSDKVDDPTTPNTDESKKGVVYNSLNQAFDLVIDLVRFPEISYTYKGGINSGEVKEPFNVKIGLTSFVKAITSGSVTFTTNNTEVSLSMLSILLADDGTTTASGPYSSWLVKLIDNLSNIQLTRTLIPLFIRNYSLGLESGYIKSAVDALIAETGSDQGVVALFKSLEPILTSLISTNISNHFYTSGSSDILELVDLINTENSTQFKNLLDALHDDESKGKPVGIITKVLDNCIFDLMKDFLKMPELDRATKLSNSNANHETTAIFELFKLLVDSKTFKFAEISDSDKLTATIISLFDDDTTYNHLVYDIILGNIKDVNESTPGYYTDLQYRGSDIIYSILENALRQGSESLFKPNEMIFEKSLTQGGRYDVIESGEGSSAVHYRYLSKQEFSKLLSAFKIIGVGTLTSGNFELTAISFNKFRQILDVDSILVKLLLTDQINLALGSILLPPDCFDFYDRDNGTIISTQVTYEEFTNETYYKLLTLKELNSITDAMQLASGGGDDDGFNMNALISLQIKPAILAALYSNVSTNNDVIISLGEYSFSTGNTYTFSGIETHGSNEVLVPANSYLLIDGVRYYTQGSPYISVSGAVNLTFDKKLPAYDPAKHMDLRIASLMTITNSSSDKKIALSSIYPYTRTIKAGDIVSVYTRKAETMSTPEEVFELYYRVLNDVTCSSGGVADIELENQEELEDGNYTIYLYDKPTSIIQSFFSNTIASLDRTAIHVNDYETSNVPGFSSYIIKLEKQMQVISSIQVLLKDDVDFNNGLNTLDFTTGVIEQTISRQSNILNRYLSKSILEAMGVLPGDIPMDYKEADGTEGDGDAIWRLSNEQLINFTHALDYLLSSKTVPDGTTGLADANVNLDNLDTSRIRAALAQDSVIFQYMISSKIIEANFIEAQFFSIDVKDTLPFSKYTLTTQEIIRLTQSLDGLFAGAGESTKLSNLTTFNLDDLSTSRIVAAYGDADSSLLIKLKISKMIKDTLEFSVLNTEIKETTTDSIEKISDLEIQRLMKALTAMATGNPEGTANFSALSSSTDNIQVRYLSTSLDLGNEDEESVLYLLYISKKFLEISEINNNTVTAVFYNTGYDYPDETHLTYDNTIRRSQLIALCNSIRILGLNSLADASSLNPDNFTVDTILEVVGHKLAVNSSILGGDKGADSLIIEKMISKNIADSLGTGNGGLPLVADDAHPYYLDSFVKLQSDAFYLLPTKGTGYTAGSAPKIAYVDSDNDAINDIGYLGIFDEDEMEKFLSGFKIEFGITGPLAGASNLGSMGSASVTSLVGLLDYQSVILNRLISNIFVTNNYDTVESHVGMHNNLDIQVDEMYGVSNAMRLFGIDDLVDFGTKLVGNQEFYEKAVNSTYPVAGANKAQKINFFKFLIGGDAGKEVDNPTETSIEGTRTIFLKMLQNSSTDPASDRSVYTDPYVIVITLAPGIPA